MKRKITTALLLGALLAGGIGEPLTARAERDLNYREQALAEMELVAENDYLELYLDEEETDIAVREKASGEIWFSNPVDTEEDSISNGYYKQKLKSQIELTYINENTQTSTMNNYVNSIADGQFEIERLEDGVRITYLIGDSSAFIIIPERISEERMQQFLDRMEESQQKRVVRNYNQEDGYYILRSGVKDYLREELAEYFAQAGYTETDYELDMQTSDEEDSHVWFQIPLTYRLEGLSLVAEVNPEEIDYNDNGFYLVNVELLRYFGASMQEDGYLFVPDGSGALIYFNNGKTTEASYSASVFGQDETFVYTAWYESQIDARYTIKMPVFGIRDGSRALFAVLEEGSAYATINAEVAGRTTAYNNMGASFTYLQYGETSLDDMVGANSYYMYSPAEFESSYSIRYFFLSGESADYSDMAAVYRQYLLDEGVLGDRVAARELPFYVEYIGAVDKQKTFLGIKYNATETLTTFAQAVEITESLNAGGIGNLNVIYSGWMNGGLHGTAATEFAVVSGLKRGGTSLKEMESFLDGLGSDLFMTLDLQYVYQDKLFDGYSNMRYAPRYFDNTNIKINDYGLASRVSEGELASLISPRYVNAITSKLAGKIQKKGITGINLGTISWELYSDLLQSSYTDRQMAMRENISAMETLAEAGQTLLGDNANAYVWGSVSELYNVPLASNNYRIIDTEIPFYEMVLHGYMEYAGEAWNLADDYETLLLKSVESGAGVNFKWIYESNSLLKETDYDYLYSVNYQAWLDRAMEDYGRLNEDLGYLEGQIIMSHEILSEDVVKVVYEDGSRVYVNYSKEETSVDGVTVPARGYLVEKGDA